MILNWDWLGLKAVFQKTMEDTETPCLWREKREGIVRQVDNDDEEPDTLDLEQVTRQGQIQINQVEEEIFWNVFKNSIIWGMMRSSSPR